MLVLIDDELRHVLSQAVAKLDNTAPLMHDVSRALLSETLQNFTAQGRPVWAGLSPVTLSRRGASAAILQDTGKLRQSIGVDSDNDTASVGTNLVYATTQQFGATKGEFGTTKKGTPIPWGDIPARSFIPITADGELQPEAAITISDVAHTYLTHIFD